MLIFSILIPEWPGVDRPMAMDYIDQLDCPKKNLEIIIAKGYQPCRQRNTAAQKAKGEILIFFDNDSCPKPNYLQQLSSHFDDPDVSAVGGPNPALPTDKYFPNLVEAVLTSRIAVLSKAARYKPTGTLRQARDSELILCNFAMRRTNYLTLGGLHESLCPNEENEFFERFTKQMPGKKILYDPELIAYEPRPSTLRAFLRKMFGYGRGRARQFKVNPSLWSLVHVIGGCLAPILPLLLFFTFGFKSLLYLFAPYSALLLIQSLTSLVSTKTPRNRPGYRLLDSSYPSCLHPGSLGRFVQLFKTHR